MFEKIRAEYKSTLKSRDTEENIDLLFFRPVGFAWACLCRKLHITPNAVTIISIFIGMAGGACFYPSNIWINILGVLLMVWAGTLDCADGQLARLTGQTSALGRILDGMAGDFWFVAIYIAICLRTNHTFDFFGLHPWLIWVIVVAAAACHAVQSAVADRYRQFHLFFLKGQKGSELDSSSEIEQKYNSLNWKKNFITKLIQFLYLRYTITQEKLTPRMQNLRKTIRSSFVSNELPKTLSDEFRKLSFPLCKWENFMTYNWRALFLYTSVLTGYPWAYPIVELTLFNVVLLYTVHRHETICRIMNQRINEYVKSDTAAD